MDAALYRASRYRKRYSRRYEPGFVKKHEEGEEPWHVEGEYRAINNDQDYDTRREYKLDMRPAAYNNGPYRWKHGNPYKPPSRANARRYQEWLDWRRQERQQYYEERQLAAIQKRNNEIQEFRDRFEFDDATE